MKHVLTIITLFIFTAAFAQKTDTLSVFFPIGKFEPDMLQLQRIDSVFNGIDKRAVEYVRGYADFLGEPVANQRLSEKRADKLGEYLKSKGFLNISATGGGTLYTDSAKQTLLGNPAHRRVDIFYRKAGVYTTDLATTNPKSQNPVNGAQQQDIQTLTALASSKVGEQLSLKGITFPGGRSIIRPEAYAVLYALVDILKANPNLKIEVQGHICCRAPGMDGLDIDHQTENLSVNRAKAVYDFLAAHMINRNRISFKGLGSSFPKVSPEITNADREQNRRVEIKVIAN